VLRLDDLVDEVGELLGLDEVPEKLVVQKRNHLVDDCQRLDPELRIDGGFIHEQDPRQ